MCQPRTNLALLNTALLRNNGFFIIKNKKLYYCFYFVPLAQCQFGAGSSPFFLWQISFYQIYALSHKYKKHQCQ